MCGKCKKLGVVTLLEEFERMVGVYGVIVVQLKCMGKCRNGPNVRVLNIACDGIQFEGGDVSLEENREGKGRRKRREAEEKRGKAFIASLSFSLEQNLNVPEATRIRISQLLEEFRIGEDEVYTFDASLTNSERAVVHELCRTMSLVSKSSGRGNQRCVSVRKRKKKQVKLMKGEKNSTCFLTFSKETKEVLQDLFTHYPPRDGEMNEEMVGNHKGKTAKIMRKKDDCFCKPSMRKVEIGKKVESLASRMTKTSNLRQIAEEKFKLPIASFRDVIASTIESHQVVLVLHTPIDAFNMRWCSSLVRLGAGKPHRSHNFFWTICGIRVRHVRLFALNPDAYQQHQIRLESKCGKHSSIMFCTNGILLRVLVGKGTGTSIKDASNEIPKDDVFEVTHIIVVKTLYLEDVLSILESTEDNHLDSVALCDTVEDTELTEEYRLALDEAINVAWSTDEFDRLLELVSPEASPKVFNYQHSLTGASPLMVFAGKGRVADVCMLISFGVDLHLRAKDGTTALEWAARENQGEVAEIIKNHMETAISNSAEEQLLLDKYLASNNPELVNTVIIVRLLRKICIDSKEGAILVFLPGWDDINKTREKLLASPFFKDSSKFLIISLHSMVPSVEQKKVFKRPPPGSRKIILSTNIAETAVTIDDVVYVIDSGRMKEKSYDSYNNVSTLYSSWVSLASAKQREGHAGRCQSGICFHLYSKTRAASLLHFQVPEIKRMPIEELCLQMKLLDPNCKIVDFLQKTLDSPVTQTIHNAIVLLQEIGGLSVDEMLTELGEKLASLPVHPSTSKMLLFSILMNCLDPALTLACASDYKDPFILSMVPEKKKRAAAAKAELASLYGGHSDQLMLQSELIRNGFIPEDVSSCSLNAQDPEMAVAPAKDNEDEESDGDLDASGSDEEGMEMHTSSGGQCGEQILSCPDNTVSVVVDRWIRFESTALDAAWIYCLRERLSAAILFKVKHPWKVLPPALEASVNAIASILSWDGRSGISLPLESVESPSSMSNAKEIDMSTPGKRKRKSLNSNGFLKSLMSNDSPHHQKSRTLISKDSHQNDLPSNNRPPPYTSALTNPYQRTPTEVPPYTSVQTNPYQRTPTQVPPYTSVHTNLSQRTPTQVPGLAGYGLARYGTYGSRENSFERQ
ncbi:hypothetical protein HHK36_000695 [Tetracentron sinense]|uniref:RNA helicase n=1 Tax=Tetracentron sinense TaxID=13715 RepID=A0A835DQY7_TETSI|nr:hypothetical protein HHK36_000695 [Tetracentron sinense]